MRQEKIPTWKRKGEQPEEIQSDGCGSGGGTSLNSCREAAGLAKRLHSTSQTKTSFCLLENILQCSQAEP